MRPPNQTHYPRTCPRISAWVALYRVQWRRADTRREGQSMATEPPTTFGDWLRRYRLAAGLTQELLAERAGLSVRGISDLERGRRSSPYYGTVRMIADAL